MSSIKRALLSVSDKTGIVELARHLQSMGVEILSTGGTAQLLREQHIPAIEVSDYTGFSEIMAGRLKTLHPKIHGGLLGRRGIDDKVMQEHNICPIDLVVVNLYPFASVTQKENCSLAEAIENIDIGGPTMLRSAAKNYNSVTVLVDVEDYSSVMAEMQEYNGATLLATRFSLAQKVFAHTAYYDALIANYLDKSDINANKIDFPSTFSMQWIKQQDMRYGENPHQKAAFYRDVQVATGTITSSVQQQGKPLSFNNVADADTALECVKRFTKAACVIVKHANPCGVALAESQLQAYQRAFSADPTSAFGGIIAFNQTLTADSAQAIISNQFVEAIIAPEIALAALAVLAQKPNIRVLSCGAVQIQKTYWDYKRVNGGLLIQESDNVILNANQLTVVTQRQPTDIEMYDLLFSWEVAKCVKSNAIVYAKDNMTVGIGAGQMSRVFSAKIAGMKASEANLQVQGAVLASDAFFPFRDGIDAAAEAGITAIIQPGGSIRDEEVIQAANAANIAMVFTGVRHFRH